MKLPAAIASVKDILLCRAGGDREVAGILCAIPTYGLDAVEVACELALEEKAPCKSLILNFLSRVVEEEGACNIAPPARLGLKEPPVANCSRYDSLRRGNHGA